jgi:hypothetical protein
MQGKGRRIKYTPRLGYNTQGEWDVHILLGIGYNTRGEWDVHTMDRWAVKARQHGVKGQLFWSDDSTESTLVPSP